MQHFVSQLTPARSCYASSVPFTSQDLAQALQIRFVASFVDHHLRKWPCLDHEAHDFVEDVRRSESRKLCLRIVRGSHLDQISSDQLDAFELRVLGLVQVSRSHIWV